MLPLILVAVGAYLIGDSVLGDKKYAKGGKLGYEYFIKGEKYFNSLEGGKHTFTHKDESGRLHFKDEKGIDRIFSPNKMSKIDGGMAHGGKTQGYDDKEDERLAMEHGKMSKKDLDSTHARRDDARFEKRGKMAHGGEIEVGDKVKAKYAKYHATVTEIVDDVEVPYAKITYSDGAVKKADLKNLQKVELRVAAEYVNPNYMAKGGKTKDYDGEKYRVADVYYSDRRKDLFIVTESKPTYIVVKYKDGFVDKITKAELKELKESGDLDYIDKNVNLLDKYIFKDAFYKGK
jgi:hypothetical protein